MYFKITLTAVGGLSKDDIELIRIYFSRCRNAYLVNEFGETGANSHVEGVVEFDTSKTSNVTERLKVLYKRMKLDVIPYITFKVKRATHLTGALIYARKELDCGAQLVLRNGWTETWISKQVQNNVKDIPWGMLKKHGTRVTQNTGAGLMFEYCKANNMSVCNLKEFLEVVRCMGDDEYLFGNIRAPGLFVDICALFGNGSSAVSIMREQMRFFSL